jgi:hypothetical protein
MNDADELERADELESVYGEVDKLKKEIDDLRRLVGTLLRRVELLEAARIDDLARR